MKSSEINKDIPYIMWCELGTLNIPSSVITKLTLSKDSTNTDDFVLGYACASTLNISINNTDKTYSSTVFKGKKITPYVKITSKTGIETTYKLGTYEVEEATKVNNIIQLSCIDSMVKFDTKWLGGTFPMTLKHLLDLICSQVGITLHNQTILNGDFIIKKGSNLLDKSCRQVLVLACELCGSFAFINRNDELELKWYDLSNPVDEIYYSNVSTLKMDENDVEITGIEEVFGTESINFGNNTYQLELTENNLLFEDSKLEEITPVIENIWNNKVEFLSYLPCTLKGKGNPSLELGDVIKIIDSDDTEHLALITSLVFTDNFSMSITSIGKSKNDNSYIGGGSSGTGTIPEKDQVKFAVGRNYSSYEIATDTKQTVASIVLGTDAETMIMAGLSISYELVADSSVTTDTKVLVEMLVNGIVYNSWTTRGLVGMNDFGSSLIPLSFPTGQCIVNLRLSADNRIIKLSQYQANLSLIVKGGEVTEAPAYPEINISQRFTQFNAINTALEIVTIGESLNMGNGGYDSSVFSELFNLINVDGTSLPICTNGDFTRLNDMANYLLSKYANMTIEEVNGNGDDE